MSKQAKTYQQLNTELQEILAKLQESDVDIDLALKLYERGQDLIKTIDKYLTTAKNNITKVG